MGKSSDGTQCLRTGSWTIVYLVLLLFTVIEKVRSDALLSSWLVNCTRHQNNTMEEDVDCLKKMLLQLSIVNGKSGESDTIETFVTHVREYGGVSRDLEEPYRITIYKSDIYVQYPLNYIQSFDGLPHEVEVFAHNCKDGSKQETPNCGWQYNKAGEKVKDSQGFCCLCTLRDKLPRWLGGETSPRRRSKQDCNSTLYSCESLKFTDWLFSSFEKASVYESTINLTSSFGARPKLLSRHRVWNSQVVVNNSAAFKKNLRSQKMKPQFMYAGKRGQGIQRSMTALCFWAQYVAGSSKQSLTTLPVKFRSGPTQLVTESDMFA